MAKYSHPLKHYTDLFNRSLPTIERWSREGAPLDDVPKMAEFIAGKESRLKNRKSLGSLQQSVTLPAIDAATVAALEKGAPAALRALEENEALLRQKLAEANKAGDSIVIRESLDAWLKCSDSLRKYDLQVAQARRDSGELIPRADSETALRMAGTWLRLSVETLISSDVPKLLAITEGGKMAKAIRSGMSMALQVNFKHAKKASSVLPDWAIRELLKGLQLEHELKEHAS